MDRVRPRDVLVAFVGLLVIGAALQRGHSVESVDVRTYVQMMRGVAEHGLPYWDNGPLDRWPLVVPHGTPAGGFVWGIYSPLYPYLLAPVFRLFGLAGASSVTLGLLVPLAIVTFALARRFVANEWYALGPAVLAIVSTPLAGKALELTAFPLAVLMATVGTYLCVRLVSGERGWLLALLAGLSWAAAAAAHVLTFPMAIVAIGVVALGPASGLRERLQRTGAALAGFAVGLAPVSLLNRLRFSSYNPISYGPPPWSGPPEMNLASQVRYGLPVAAVAIATCALLFFLRKVRFAWIAVLAGAVLVVGLEPTLRERGLRCVGLAFGYIVDVGSFDLDPQVYLRERDGFGLLIHGRVNKATLQATPVVALAFAAFLRAPPEKRWPLIALLAPAAGLYASFLTRANMPYTDGFGVPWLSHRYTFAALPALLTAAFAVVERIRAPRETFLGAAALGALVILFLFNVSDHALSKRLIVLALSLAAAFGSLAATIALLLRPGSAVRRRLAHRLLALALAMGVGIGVGHDFRAHFEGKRWCDRRVDDLGAVVPRRFALLGHGGDFDILLTATATHDVRYADVAHFPRRDDLLALIQYWRSEGREVYVDARAPAPHSLPTSPWPDVTFVPTPTVPDVLHVEFVNVVPAAP